MDIHSATPEREPAPLVNCPSCDGIGQVGGSNSPCQACWMRGLVPAWRAVRLLADQDWWFGHQGMPRRSGQTLGLSLGVDDDPDPRGPRDPAPAAALPASGLAEPAARAVCATCGITKPCAECPYGGTSDGSLLAA